MSKYVKDLITNDIKSKLEGVEDALLVNVVGIDANRCVELRRQLREKDIQLVVVKNSLARRATEGGPLQNAFAGEVGGSLAVVWGSEDFISLTKEVVGIQKSGEFAPFEARGGVMDGEQLSADKVAEISKWPNRAEQLSLLMGQVLSPGAQLVSQLLAPGGLLVSQLDEMVKKGGGDESAPEA